MLTDQWQGFTGLPDFPDPSLVPTHLKNLFDFLSARAVPRYSTTAERDAELVSPPDGALCAVAGSLYLRRAGQWRRLYGEKRMETGSVSISYGGESYASAEVAFASPFATPPVVVTSYGSVSTSPRTITAAVNVTASGFTARVLTADGSTHTGTRVVSWTAVG